MTAARNSPLAGPISAAAGFLAIGFLFASGAKLNDPASVEGLFASWGLGVWAIVPAAWVEFGLGLLLFRRRTRPVGAGGLIAWMLLFGGLQLSAGQLAAAGASGAVLLFCLAVLATHDGPWAPCRPEEWIPAPLIDPPRGLEGAFFLLPLIGLAFLIRWNIGGVVYWALLPVLAWRHRRIDGARSRSAVESSLLYLLVLGFGLSGVWSFIGHYFRSDTVAASIDWAQGSPFQHELAFYHLAMGVAALLCLWRRDGYWYASGLIPSIFLYGAMIVHVQDWWATGNTAPGNWGFAIWFGDVVLPTVMLGLLWARLAVEGRGGDEGTPGGITSAVLAVPALEIRAKSPDVGHDARRARLNRFPPVSPSSPAPSVLARPTAQPLGRPGVCGIRAGGTVGGSILGACRCLGIGRRCRAGRRPEGHRG